jgi:hypothetical protein
MVPLLFTATVFAAGRLVAPPRSSWRQVTRPAIVGGLSMVVIAATIRGAWPWNVVLYAAPLALLAVAMLVERAARAREKSALLLRLCVFVAGLVLLSFAARAGRAEVRPVCHSADQWIAAHLVPGELATDVHWQAFWAQALGLLAAVSEAGTAVQVAMALLVVGPPRAASAKFEHSALIGSIERVLVIIFVLNGAYNAIAFILTAKGIVRFHDTAETGAAEYVLVGTLLSTLFAIALGLAVPLLYRA